MMQKFLEKIDPFIVLCFAAHDVLSNFLARHLFGIKRTLLIVAHLSLFGFLFPDLRKDFGEMALNVLLVILFLGPLARIFQTRLLVQLVGIRRELGILTAYLATVHGIGYMLDPDWFAVFIAPYWKTDFFAIEPRLLLGMFAYALTLPLLFTSNTLAMRFLGGKKWKLLHRLVYGVLVAAIFHRYFTGGVSGDMAAWAQTLSLIAVYVLVKVLAWKNFLTPLREAILSVSARYTRYKLAQKTQPV